MYCIVIRDFNGKYYRETSETAPDNSDICYWENYYSVQVNKPNGTYYDNTCMQNAVVTNVYEIAD